MTDDNLDLDCYDEHKELITQYNRRGGYEAARVNREALTKLESLLRKQVITPSDLEILIAAIPPNFDDDAAFEIRRGLISSLDFMGINIPNRVGRPASPRVMSRDILTDKVSERTLKAALRAYWKNRKTNNAEMGRVIALLEWAGYINVDGGRRQATMEYFTRIVKRTAKPWSPRAILRGYGESRDLKGPEFKEATKNCTKIIWLLEKLPSDGK